MEGAQKCLEGLTEINGRRVIVEPATKKTLAILKGPISEGVEYRVRSIPQTQLVSFEVDNTKTTYFATVKFDTEDAMQRFLADVTRSPKDCKLTRP